MHNTDLQFLYANSHVEQAVDLLHVVKVDRIDSPVEALVTFIHLLAVVFFSVK